MDSFFGFRPVCVCQAVTLGLIGSVFIQLTTTQAALVGFAYLVLRALVAEEW